MGADGGVVIVHTYGQEDEFHSLFGSLEDYFCQWGWHDSDRRFIHEYDEEAIFFRYGTDCYDHPSPREVLQYPFGEFEYPDEWNFQDLTEHLLTTEPWRLHLIGHMEDLILQHCVFGEYVDDRFGWYSVGNKVIDFVPTEKMVLKMQDLFHWNVKDWQKKAEKWSRRIVYKETWT